VHGALACAGHGVARTIVTLPSVSVCSESSSSRDAVLYAESLCNHVPHRARERSHAIRRSGCSQAIATMKPVDPVPDRLARIQRSIDALMEALHRQKTALDTIRDDLAAYRAESDGRASDGAAGGDRSAK
jgi:hypothetical protein